jgi:hypothetical protein
MMDTDDLHSAVISAAIAGLLTAGLWLSYELRAAQRMEDCITSGRRGCFEITAPRADPCPLSDPRDGPY